MEKQEIIQKLIKEASILDAAGEYAKADAIHEQIRVANQADNWANLTQGVGNVANWITNPLGNGFNAVKDLVSPALRGLTDDRGALIEALNQFSQDLQNSNINNLYKGALEGTMNQIIQSASQMNPEAIPATNEPIAPPPAAAPQRSREEILKQLHSNTAKFRHVESQVQQPAFDDAQSLLKKLNDIYQRFSVSIPSKAPGYNAVMNGLKTMSQSLSKIVRIENNSVVQNQQNAQPSDLIEKLHVAQSDPIVQSALKAYITYGLNYGPQKMFAFLESNAQNQNVDEFKMLLKNAWTSEYQKAWEDYSYKARPQNPAWPMPQKPAMPTFNSAPGFNNLFQTQNNNKPLF